MSVFEAHFVRHKPDCAETVEGETQGAHPCQVRKEGGAEENCESFGRDFATTFLGPSHRSRGHLAKSSADTGPSGDSVRCLYQISQQAVVSDEEMEPGALCS